MDRLFSVASVITLSAITPGPNNFIIMSRAATAGIAPAGRAIAAIVVGSLLMLLAAAGLIDGADLGWAVPWITLAGCALLAIMAAQQFIHAAADRAPPLLSSIPALIGFQWVNPKAWVMIAVVAAATQDEARWVLVPFLFVLICTLCLLLWAWFGTALATWAATPRRRRWVERALAAALFFTAGHLGLTQIGGLA